MTEDPSGMLDPAGVASNPDGRSDFVPKLTLRQLTYFIAATQHQSVLRAAEALNVSSPSVSTAISQIEEMLQVQLFIRRHSRGLVLTPTGRELAMSARDLLSHARDLESLGSQADAKAAHVTLGCLTTLAPYLIPHLLTQVAAMQRPVRLRWREGRHEELVDALETGTIDLAILYDYDMPTTLQTDPLREMPLQVVLPEKHRLAGSACISIVEMQAEPFILLDHPKTRDYFLSLFGRWGVEPNIAHRTPSFELVRSLVAHGCGFSLLNFCPPYGSEPGLGIISRSLDGLGRPQQLVAAKLYRFRPSRAMDLLLPEIRASVERLTDVAISGG